MVRTKIETIITKKISFLSKLNENKLGSAILFLKTDKAIDISNLFYQQFYHMQESYFKEHNLSKWQLQSHCSRCKNANVLLQSQLVISNPKNNQSSNPKD